MEQRWSPRTPINIGVEVGLRGTSVFEGVASDIGMGGVFIRTDDSTIKKNAKVDLHFSLSENSLELTHQISATVVRTEKEGIGCMFLDFDGAAFQTLQQILTLAQEKH